MENEQYPPGLHLDYDTPQEVLIDLGRELVGHEQTLGWSYCDLCAAWKVSKGRPSKEEQSQRDAGEPTGLDFLAQSLNLSHSRVSEYRHLGLFYPRLLKFPEELQIEGKSEYVRLAENFTIEMFHRVRSHVGGRADKANYEETLEEALGIISLAVKRSMDLSSLKRYLAGIYLQIPMERSLVPREHINLLPDDQEFFVEYRRMIQDE